MSRSWIRRARHGNGFDRRLSDTRVGDCPGDECIRQFATCRKRIGLVALPQHSKDGVPRHAVRRVRQPQWTYTQGCDKCGPPPRPFTEPAYDVPNHVGDCTDFVQVVIKNYLGSSWTHQKMSTGMFGAFWSNPTTLAKHGFAVVDSSALRPGDVVVRDTVISGTINSGHAGIFGGWAAVRGGAHPIGWANDGYPARPQHAGHTGPTGPFDFFQTSGQKTMYFRPQT